jgi:hypothetical protein
VPKEPAPLERLHVREIGERLASLFEIECRRIAAEEQIRPDDLTSYAIGILANRELERRLAP